MSESLSTKQNQYVTPPRATESPAAIGQVCVLQTSTSASYLELDSLFQQKVGSGTPSQQRAGVVGNEVTIFADAQDLGIIFGPTAASVTGSGSANVPALATYGSVSSGAYTAAAKSCWRIPAGTSLRFLLQQGVDNFLGFVAAGSGLLRLYQSSPGTP